MKYICLIIMLILSHKAYSQCDSNILANGTFTSTEGSNTVASGWVNAGLADPDVNDEIGPISIPPYSWTGTPIGSPSGGTWQNVFDTLEAFAQIVNLNIGQAYSLCFEYAAQGISGPDFTYTGPVGVNIFINGILTHTTTDDSTQFSWETDCHTFTATQVSTEIKFSASKEAYVAIDGACLIKAFPNSNQDFTKKKSKLMVSPNPFANSTTIKFNNPTNNSYVFTLYNSQGGIAQKLTDITSEQITLERNHLRKGLYYFVLSSKKIQNSYKGTLIVE